MPRNITVPEIVKLTFVKGDGWEEAILKKKKPSKRSHKKDTLRITSLDEGCLTSEKGMTTVKCHMV